MSTSPIRTSKLVELGVTSVDHYFDTLGGIARAVRRARGGGEETPVYIGDQTRGARQGAHAAGPDRAGKPVAHAEPEVLRGPAAARRRGRAPDRGACDQHARLVGHDRPVEPWVYQRLTETFVLDEAMRRRLAALNPQASARMANRLLEASDRNYWQPDPETLAALQGAADELEDRLEGIAAE